MKSYYFAAITTGDIDIVRLLIEKSVYIEELDERESLFVLKILPYFYPYSIITISFRNCYCKKEQMQMP